MPKEGETKKKRFRGFRKPTYTMVPDELFDELMADLRGAELKVLLYIIRRTFGFKKENDNISLSQMVKGIVTKAGKVLDQGTGLSKASVARAVKSLEERRVILRTKRRTKRKGDQPTTYSLNIIPVSKNETPPGKKMRHPPVPKLDTQQTVIQDTEDNNIVVALLINKGITKRTARKLSRDYPNLLIRQKIELLDYLEETGSPLVTKNPAGYLRRAIEEDYEPPRGFKTKDEREAEAREWEEAERRAERARKTHPAKMGRRGQALKRYGTSERLIDLWREAQLSLQVRVTKATYDTYLRDATLLSFDDSIAVLGVSNQFAQEWIQGRMAGVVTSVLEQILEESLDLKVEVY